MKAADALAFGSTGRLRNRLTEADWSASVPGLIQATHEGVFRRLHSFLSATPAANINMLDLTHDAIFLRRRTGAIEYWNRAAEEMYGWTAAEAIGRLSHELLKTVFPASVEQIEKELVRSGRWEGELVHTRKDGTQVTVASRWSLQRDEASTLVGVLVYEIPTVYAQLPGAMRVQRSELEARLMARDAVSATVAHEIRQPLTAMVTNAFAGLHFLDRSTPNLEKAKELFNRIATDGLRAGAVVESIRSYFKNDDRAKTPLDVNELIQEALALERADLQKHRILVQAAPNKQLPAVHGNRVQLQQVLLNLIANAIDAMVAGDGSRVLLVKSGPHEGGGVIVSVEDTGAGINPQDFDRIFNPLFTTKPDGMGMGLSICRAIIEAHHGRLWASSNSPRGAIFQFTLCADDSAPHAA